MNTLKLLFIFIFILLVTVRPTIGRQAAAKPVLRILNWSEYILLDDRMTDEDSIVRKSPVLSDFAKIHACRIEYFEYESTLEMYKNIQNLPGYYDILIVTHSEIPDLVKAGLIAKLDKSKIPNLKYISKKYSGMKQDPNNDYSIPYLVGTTGIVYNKEKLRNTKINWNFYFHPSKDLVGKIGMLDDSMLMFPIALQSLGFDPNSTDLGKIRQAGRLIYNLKKAGFIGLCSSDIALIKKKLLNQEILMATLYSGDALSIYQKSNKKIEYIIPEEGGEYYVDSFVIQTGSKNRALAHQFINYMLQPEIHAASAVYLRYTCPNEKAYEFIKRDAPGIVNHPAIYPPEEVLNKLTCYGNKSPEIKRMWDKIFKGVFE